MIKTGHISRCQVCNSSQLHLVLDLGHQPLANTLPRGEELNQPEATYPLRMMWCQNCTCVQLDYCVAGEQVYHPGYPYLQSITKPLLEYQKNISRSLIEKYALKKNDLAVDIGSGDGALLSGFKQNGLRVLGVEPTNIARIANKNGIKTIQKFFNIKLAKEIVKKHGQASVITATNVFAHMQTLGEVIGGIHTLLKKGGVFVSETHYLLDIIKGSQFDTMYHEHLRTYSLKSLIKLFEYYDFTVTDAERGDRYGGNLRVHVTKGKGIPVSPRVVELLKLEKEAGLDTLATYEKFADRVRKVRLAFVDFLVKAKMSGKHVVGKSCPARASTLLNYYGVDSELMPYLAEQSTSLKVGKHLAGKHIPIVDEKCLFRKQPDFVVLLAWHYAWPIMERLKSEGLKSDFVIPLPDLTLVKKSQVKKN